MFSSLPRHWCYEFGPLKLIDQFRCDAVGYKAKFRGCTPHGPNRMLMREKKGFFSFDSIRVMSSTASELGQRLA